MVNLFRPLILPWLITLFIMLVFTGIWYHFNNTAEQRVQIEQASATLQLSIRPLLNAKDNDLVTAQLNQLRLGSAVPLRSIAVYTSGHRLQMSTDLPDSIRPFLPVKPVKGFSIQFIEQGILVLNSFSNNTDWPDINEPALPDQYYLLLLFEPVLSHSVWMIPVGIIGVLGILVLLLFQNNLAQLLQRQNTDVSLLVHKLNQLRGGQHNVSVNEELVPELAALKPAINGLATYHQEAVATVKLGAQQLQHRLDSIEQEKVLLQQQNLILQQQQSAIQQTVQSRLQALMQLQQQTDLDTGEYQKALTAQLELFQLEFSNQNVKAHCIKLTDFVQQLRPSLIAWVNDKKIELQIFEHANNLCYRVDIAQPLLALLVESMTHIASRAPAITELTLRIKLDTASAATTLHISITGSGEGITSRTRELLNGDNTGILQWHESDIGFFIVTKRLLKAALSIQSLDGLGCTIALSIPLSGAELNAPVPAKHALLFDSQHSDLIERARAIEPIAKNVVKSSDIADLGLKCTKYPYDFALILLPEPADILQWRTLLDALSKRCPVYCYALASQLAVWREALRQTVHQTPLCLAAIQLFANDEAKLPRLLVVDDNATNLSFIQVLLKDQPVQLQTANCGAAALQMCQQQYFDVILLDIQLPDITGTEVARQLRQLSDYQTTPILAFTAHALEEEMHSFMQAGMNDVIIKPLDVAKLSQILDWCLGGKTNNVC